MESTKTSLSQSNARQCQALPDTPTKYGQPETSMTSIASIQRKLAQAGKPLLPNEFPVRNLSVPTGIVAAQPIAAHTYREG